MSKDKLRKQERKEQRIKGTPPEGSGRLRRGKGEKYGNPTQRRHPESKNPKAQSTRGRAQGKYHHVAHPNR